MPQWGVSWFQIKIYLKTLVNYLMKIEVRVFFTVRHITKHVSWCMSQYSTTHHIITNFKQQSKRRNIKKTVSPWTNKMQNAEKAG